MALVMPIDLSLRDASETLERATEARAGLADYLRAQWEHVQNGLSWPLVLLVALGLGRQLWCAVRGRMRSEDWLLLALFLPSPIYVTLFPFRGVNHDFMWCLSLGYFAATAALGLSWLWGRLDTLRASSGRRFC